MKRNSLVIFKAEVTVCALKDMCAKVRRSWVETRSGKPSVNIFAWYMSVGNRCLVLKKVGAEEAFIRTQHDCTNTKSNGVAVQDGVYRLPSDGYK